MDRLETIARSCGNTLVLVSSRMGALHRLSPGAYAYRSSKAAANKVAQLLALDLKHHGVIVCPMHPGWVQTDMGGPTADITVEESAAGLIQVIDALTLDQSGRFWMWDGTELDW